VITPRVLLWATDLSTERVTPLSPQGRTASPQSIIATQHTNAPVLGLSSPFAVAALAPAEFRVTLESLCPAKDAMIPVFQLLSPTHELSRNENSLPEGYPFAGAKLFGILRSGDRAILARTDVTVHFRDGKLAHEHIYWDQGSVLKQIGLLSDPGLPIFGAEAAAKVSNAL